MENNYDAFIVYSWLVFNRACSKNNPIVMG
jgi:hypothetical protein